MFDVIEALINSNSLLKIDQRNLDSDELIQVAQLRAKERAQVMLPIEEGSIDEYEGGTKKTKPSKASTSKNVTTGKNIYSKVEEISYNSIDRELMELELQDRMSMMDDKTPVPKMSN
jgi:hypothetical protein